MASVFVMWLNLGRVQLVLSGWCSVVAVLSLADHRLAFALANAVCVVWNGYYGVQNTRVAS